MPTKPDTTGKPGRKGRGRGRPGEARYRSAAAVERRAERGALRRAEALLAQQTREDRPVDAPVADQLSYVEGLRLQSAPQLGAEDFLNDQNTVRGGLPQHQEVSRSARRGFARFAERYPQLAEVVRGTPGRSARRSFAVEQGGQRVRQGFLWRGLESVAEEGNTAEAETEEQVYARIQADLETQVDEAHEAEEDRESVTTVSAGGRAVTRVPPEEATVLETRTVTHPPTSVWDSASEGEEAEGTLRHIPSSSSHRAEQPLVEVAQERAEAESVDNYSRSSYSDRSSYSRSSNWSWGRDHWERYEPYAGNLRYQQWNTWDWRQRGYQGQDYGYHRNY